MTRVARGRHSGWVLGCAIGSLVASGFAHAYVPPASFALAQLAKKRAGYRTLKIRSTLTELDSQGQARARLRSLVWVDYGLGRVRSRLTDELGRGVAETDRRLGELPLAQALLLERDGVRLQALARAAGVRLPTEDELAQLPDEEARHRAEAGSVTRTPGGVAWLYNAGESLGDPSLAILKDGFVAAIARVPLSPGARIVEYGFESYRYQGEFPYPRTVSLGEPGAERPDIRDELNELLVNGDSPDLKAEWRTVFGAARGSAFSFADEADSAARGLAERVVNTLR